MAIKGTTGSTTKEKAHATRNGNGHPPKKSRNSSYEEVNVGEKKK